jgi:hypothetical protein
MKISIRKIFFVFILVLYSFTGNAQNNINDPFKIDSLKKVLQTQKGDTNKVNTLNELSDKLWYNYNNSLQYSKEALSLSGKKGKAIAYFNIAWAFLMQSNYSEALKNY